MKNINEILREFDKYYGVMFESGDFEALRIDVITAITSAFEETRMEKVSGKTIFDLGSEFSTPRDYRREGYNSALTKIKNNQDLFLKKDLF